MVIINLLKLVMMLTR